MVDGRFIQWNNAVYHVSQLHGLLKDIVYTGRMVEIHETPMGYENRQVGVRIYETPNHAYTDGDGCGKTLWSALREAVKEAEKARQEREEER